MDQILEDMFSRLKAAGTVSKVDAEQVAQKASVMSIGEALEKEFPDHIARAKFAEKLHDTMVREKLIRTPDYGTLRVASIEPRTLVRRNKQTVTLNFLESQGPPAIAQDYRYQIREWNIGEIEAEVWNIENDLPNAAYSNRATRSNTITCVGNKIQASLMVQEMMMQQADIDVIGTELDFEVDRIRRKMNSMLIANTESKAEGQFGIPQLGGFVTRSTMYNVNVGGGDLTRALIQGRVDAIANVTDIQGWGYSLPLLAFTNGRQLQVLRDIIISEYGGIYPTDRIAYEEELKSRLQDFRVDVGMAFETMPGPVIPFVYEPMLPSGTTIIFDASKPRLVKFKLGGQLGPFVLTRPTEKLQRLDVVLDLFSISDSGVDTRAVLTNHL